MRRIGPPLLLSFAILTLACIPAGPPLPPPTNEQSSYLIQRNSQPTDFTLDAQAADLGWSRAKSWLGRCSDFKLQIVDNEILETYSPPGEAAVRMGYSVSREKLGTGDWHFNVRAVTGNSMAGNIALVAAQTLALYIASGTDFPGYPCSRTPDGRWVTH